jgi:DNA polymerase-3 subunit alpha
MVRAKELGMTHIAITDHGVLSGHREFQRAAKTAGITPILGCEMYISPTDRFDRRAVAKRDDNTQAYNHLTVLAQNETGLRNLNRLSEMAWTEGFYSKPRIDLELLEEYNEGLVVTSGCLNGLIAKAIANKLDHQASMLTDQFKRIFGDRFFIEIQGHNPPEINAGLMTMANKHGVLPVVTSDCHYARKEDLWLEDAMLILSTNPKAIKDVDFDKSQKMDMIERLNYLYPDRQMTFQDYEIFLRSYEDHRILLAKQGIDEQPIKNTLVVADMIGDYPYYEGLDLLPKLDDSKKTPMEILWEMVLKGAAERGTLGIPEYDERRKADMDIIEQKDIPIYFIIEADAIQWGKSKGMLFGPGRGSGAGFLPNYELGITSVDPIKYNLLTFRFLDPGRADMPDIDTDVERARRGELKDYIVRKYKNVANIATFGTFQGKNSIRDAARVFKVPLGEVNRALKGADWPSSFFEHFTMTEKGAAFAKKYPEVMKLARFMFGRLKSKGMHAGGLIVSNLAINEYAPMETAKDPNDESAPRVPLVALDMNEIADIGFIKYDWLGLKALEIIANTIKDIKTRHDRDIDLEALPLDDPRVYDSISHGYTKGVFQVEATPYTNLVLTMGGIKNFGELALSNALVRPGAAKSSAGQSFINRKNGEEKWDYLPDTEWFTNDTYGTIIYQEQVMLAMTELAGMSMGDANKVRKIIGKKRDVKEFEQYKSMFVDGASKKISRDAAEGLWHDFEAHAGYSFNKSHSVAYSMLSYWTAWLKLYYPIEFMKNVLVSEGDKDYVLDYLIESKRLGLRIVLPNVNLSGINFEIQRDEKGEFIRFGLSNIKYISGKLAHRLDAIRPFNSYQELSEAVMAKGSGLNSRVLQALNAIGGAVFPDNLRTGNERSNYFEYLNIPAFETKEVPVKMRAQFQALDEFSEDDAFVSMGMVRGIKTGDGWARLDIVDETGSAGVFADEHTPIEKGNLYVLLISNNRVSRYIPIKDIPDGGDFVDFLEAETFPDIPDGMLRVVAFKSKKTRAGDRMADVIFSDNEKDLIGAMVFPQKFHEAFTKLRPGAVVDVKLAKTKDGKAFFVNSIL